MEGNAFNERRLPDGRVIERDGSGWRLKQGRMPLPTRAQVNALAPPLLPVEGFADAWKIPYNVGAAATQGILNLPWLARDAYDAMDRQMHRPAAVPVTKEDAADAMTIGGLAPVAGAFVAPRRVPPPNAHIERLLRPADPVERVVIKQPDPTVSRGRMMDMVDDADVFMTPEGMSVPADFLDGMAPRAANVNRTGPYRLNANDAKASLPGVVLDMSDAARQARAAELGFDERTMYHGSPDFRGVKNAGAFEQRNVNHLNSKTGQWESAPQATYFTPNRRVAATYADDTRAFDYQNAEPEVFAGRVRGGSLMEIDAGGSKFSEMPLSIVRMQIPEAQRAAFDDLVATYANGNRGALRTGELEIIAQKLGYDGFRVRNVLDTYSGGGPKTEIVGVYDPARIRSTDAAFDPAQINSTNLLAANDSKAAIPGVVLDMSPEARLARAREMGFDTETTWYHGADTDFDSFSSEFLGKNTGAPSARKGHFFASQPHVAEFYSTWDKGDLLEYGGLLPKSMKAADLAAVEKNNILERPKQIEAAYLEAAGSRDARAAWPKLAIEANRLFDEGRRSTVDDYLDALSDAPKSSKFFERLPPNHPASLWVSQNWKELEGAFQDARRFRDIYRMSERHHEGGSEDGNWAASKQNPSPATLPVHLRMKNPLIHDFLGAGHRDVSFNDLLESAIGQGHDGAIFKSVADPYFSDIAVVFDPKNIRSVNANFNPSLSASSSLMAANPGTAALPGILVSGRGKDQRRR